MLRLSDKLPGTPWTAGVPVSFNIYSSMNPDMITVYYYPKDVTADSKGEDEFTSFKKQLLSSNVLKNGVKSIDYIDDEDDVIHIDSEQEFLEAIKFAKAYKETYGQSVFLLIDEKSKQEVDSENVKVSTDDDKAEQIVEENKVDSTQKVISEIDNNLKAKDKVDVAGQVLLTSLNNELQSKAHNLKKKTICIKVDDKSDVTEPNTCCKNYLEQFKQEIINEVTKNVLKKLSSALNPSEDDAKKNEENRERIIVDVPEASCSHQSPSMSSTFLPIKLTCKSTPSQRLSKYPSAFNPENTRNRILSGNHVAPGSHRLPYWYPKSNPYFSEEIMKAYDFPVTLPPKCSVLPEESRCCGKLKTKLKEDSQNLQLQNDKSVIPATVEKKSSNEQKKKPKISNYVVLKRDDLTQEQKSLIEQFKKIKPIKRPNALEIKSTVKKIATPSPKKSSSSKIKNKTKVEKELLLNAMKMSELKLDCDEVQKTGGCKRKSHSTEENRVVKSCSFDPLDPRSSMSLEAYENLLKKKLDHEKQFTSNFLKNMRIFPNSTVVPVKDEEKNTKDNSKETWEDDGIGSDNEFMNDVVEKGDKLRELDQQSTSDDVSTLSETSSLSEISEDHFELVYYDKETNDVGIKLNKRDSSSLNTKENSTTKNTPEDSDKQEDCSVQKKVLSTEESSKKAEAPKKEVRFDVVVEDIGPDNESEELIPELTKRPGGDYSYVRETLPKAEQDAAEKSGTTEKITKKEMEGNPNYPSTMPIRHRNSNTIHSGILSGPLSPVDDEEITDKDNQQSSSSYSTYLPGASSLPSALKPPKIEEKLKKVEKKFREAEKKLKEAEKKSKACYEKSKTKTSRDERTPGSSGNPLPTTTIPPYQTYNSRASCYPNSSNSKPEDTYLYNPYININSYLQKQNLANHSSMPMPPVYPPPPPYPPNFSSASSTTRSNPFGLSSFHSTNLDQGYFPPPPFEAYQSMAPSMAQNMENIPFSSASANTFDSMNLFHENIATEAAAHAYTQARKAIDNYLNSQQNERR